MTEHVALAADHAGFPLKTEMVSWLQAQGNEVLDLGASSFDPGETTQTTPKRSPVRLRRAKYDVAF